MSLRKKCNDCLQLLPPNTDSCSCGWKYQNDIDLVGDDRCSYQALGRRCPLPGTNCNSLFGRGRWYCIGHLQNLGNAVVCEEILIDAENNVEAIMEKRIDWRKRLFPEEYRAEKNLIGFLVSKLFKNKRG